MDTTALSRFLPALTSDELAQIQLEGLKATIAQAVAGSPFYREHLSGVEPEDIRSLDDLRALPTTDVQDLRDGYPLPLLSVPEGDVVRIHASSGTTGKRKVLAYTQQDVDDWAVMMARCMALAGVTPLERVQICVGYGLWTAGAGFQRGCEELGAMALPVGPGLLDIQLQLLEDMRPATVCSTASMALLLAEEVERRGLRERIGLKRIIFGAEAHTPKMRRRFEELLGLESSHDISGMTELYGPGAGIECHAREGIHYWADYYILEVVDPRTLEPVAPGEVGEMVVTTLRKQAAPLIRYRTHDLTRLLPSVCQCGCDMPRHDRILGRSDDMFIVRGVNIYPGQIAAVLGAFPQVGSEYQIVLTREEGRDHMRVSVERAVGVDEETARRAVPDIATEMQQQLLVRAEVTLLAPGELPRTFAKSRRVIDERDAG